MSTTTKQLKKQLSTEWNLPKINKRVYQNDKDTCKVRNYNRIKSLLEEINKEKKSIKENKKHIIQNNKIISQNKMIKVSDFISQGIGQEIIIEFIDKKGIKKQKKIYKLIENKKFDKNVFRTIVLNKDKIVITKNKKNIGLVKPNLKSKSIISNFKKHLKYEK